MFFSNYVATLKQYASFDGRTGRKEFWYFVLAHYIVLFLLGFLEGFMGWLPDTDEAVISNLYALATLLPYLGAGIRRMHDSDRSGWWILVPLYNLYLWVQPSTPGPNRFGDASGAAGSAKYCAHCGAGNSAEANFCKECGQPMTI